MTALNIKALLAQKSALEKSCERKNGVWEKTLEEHYPLEKIDAELLESGYYDTK